jgi:endonuclease III related protein
MVFLRLYGDLLVAPRDRVAIDLIHFNTQPALDSASLVVTLSARVMIESPLPARSIRAALRRAYSLMRGHFGHQAWWPAQTPFEVCVGAILTQNTNWSNVERALQNLRDRSLLDPRRLSAISDASLTELLRPAGCSRVKARRLRAFLDYLVNQCAADLDALWAGTTQEARRRLLAIHGIGPETADSMLLYAGRKPSFVIDAYTARIFVRHGWCLPKTNYAQLQQLAESALRQTTPEQQLNLWQDYHAQLVTVGKHYCRAGIPRCEQCPLRSLLPKPAPRAHPKPKRHA